MKTEPDLPPFSARLLASLLPHAERDEVLADLADEYAARTLSAGRSAARFWLWRQVAGSVPSLLRRSWWRGWTGFEPAANRMRPGGGVLRTTSELLRFTVRRLLRNRGYATIVVVTLALGVAGTATVFSVSSGLLRDPLPVADEDDVVVFWQDLSWSDAEFDHVRPALTAFDAVAAYLPMDVTLTREGAPARLAAGIAATPEIFRTLGVDPAFGRGFLPEEGRTGGEPVAVLGHSLWRELGGNPGIVGSRLTLSGTPHTVVGVMAPGFWFPDPSIQVWTAEQVDPADGVGNKTLIARVAAGTPPSVVASQLDRVADLLGERFDYPEGWDKRDDPGAIPLRDHLLGSVGPGLTALLVAMVLILLVACGNVAAMMLGQIESRGPELAIRMALGAGRGRLLHQLAIEAIVIGLVAGVVGTVLAVPGFRLIVGALPLGELAATAVLDWTIFWAAMAIAVVSATAIAVVPAVALRKSEVRDRIATQRTGGVTGRGGRLEGGLVVAQVALVVVLVAGATLLIRSVARLGAIETGVVPDRVAVLDVLLPSAGTATELPGRMRGLLEAASGVVGVEHVAATQKLPLRGSGHNWGIRVEGDPDLPATVTAFRIVTEGYFETMGIGLTSGRVLLRSDGDPDAEEGVVVVNRALAERFFPGIDPVGRRIAFSDRWDRIVGVVENVAEAGLDADPVPTRYTLYDQVDFFAAPQSIVVRAAPGRDLAAVLDEARRAIQDFAPDVAISETTTMNSVLARAQGATRQVMPLLSMLGVFGLVLGTVGVHGVVSHFVNRRRRDWGVQIALGLKPRRLVGQIVGRGLRVVGAGVLLGIIGFLGLARLVASLLYDVTPADPASLLLVAGLLLGVGAAAAYLPARRAAAIDPMLALRES